MTGLRTRTVDFEDPAALVEAARGKLGIDLLRELCSGKSPAAPIQATLGFDLVEVQDGFARFQATPSTCSAPPARCMAASQPRCSIRPWALP